MLPSIKNDLEPLKSSLMEVVAKELVKGNFDHEEYDESMKSSYYKHIDFRSI